VEVDLNQSKEKGRVLRRERGPWVFMISSEQGCCDPSTVERGTSVSEEARGVFQEKWVWGRAGC